MTTSGETGRSHCWEDGPRKDESWDSIGTGSSCMLLDGHEGPHEFTWDDEIVVTFNG